MRGEENARAGECRRGGPLIESPQPFTGAP